MKGVQGGLFRQGGERGLSEEAIAQGKPSEEPRKGQTRWSHQYGELPGWDMAMGEQGASMAGAQWTRERVLGNAGTVIQDHVL